ncbi:MAG: hypothetical protein WAV28_14180 [Sedimentisphaerales bacterium]
MKQDIGAWFTPPLGGAGRVQREQVSDHVTFRFHPARLPITTGGIQRILFTQTDHRPGYMISCSFY